jgi:hypothetical protein
VSGLRRPEWLTSERLAELRAIGLAVPEPDGCTCCGETQHGCGCPLESVALTALADTDPAPGGEQPAVAPPVPQQDMAAGRPRNLISEACQWGRHDECTAWRAGVPHSACQCPLHDSSYATCWGDISRIQVRR